MQTSDSASASSARAAQASRESAQAAKDRRTAARDDDGPGGVAIFSELVAQAGAKLDAQPAGGSGPDGGPGNGEQDETSEAGVPAGALPAGVQTMPTLPAARRLGAGGPGEAAVTRGLPSGGVLPGGEAGTAPGAATVPAAGGAADPALEMAATGGVIDARSAAAADGTAGSAEPAGTAVAGSSAALARAAAQAAAGRTAQIAHDPLGAGAAPGAAQAALAQALREIRSDASERATASRTAPLGGDGVSAERGSRLRRGGPDAAAAAAAGRDAANMVDGMGSAGSLTGRAIAEAANLALAGSGAQSGRSPADAAGGGAGGDASVFALTMNQAATGISLAATRADMLAEATQAIIDVPVDHSDFAEAFARQSASLVVQGSNQAEIQLNPRDLGPIRIAITLDADAASLDIAAEHAETRAAIEASLPALRQMLADQGVRLADYRLDSQTAAERQQHGGGGDAGRQESGRQAQAGETAQPQLPPSDPAALPANSDAAALASGFGRRDGPPGDRRSSGAASPVAGAAGALRGGLPGGLPAGATQGGNSSRIDLYA